MYQALFHFRTYIWIYKLIVQYKSFLCELLSPCYNILLCGYQLQFEQNIVQHRKLCGFQSLLLLFSIQYNFSLKVSLVFMYNFKEKKYNFP